MKINILHISKTGGSYLKKMIKSNPDLDDKFVIWDHHIKASDLKGQPYLTVLRNPATRFFSAFYSRRRMGQPKYFRLWNIYEIVVFYHYKTPEIFVESLINASIVAKFLFKRIRHIKDHQADWLDDAANLPVTVLRQECLDSDFYKFMHTRFPEVNFESRVPEHSNQIEYNISERHAQFLNCRYDRDFRLWKDLN
ncbi:hypothetical protein NYF23_05775 [SAR92 clade bacterium H455]|uniref:Sulfotransferase family protein n=1 Tax=SAR92 clade bacterium H455 TaxID=2974818 RepID=A0ABY5TVE1_9GAMM|nr:hypothetical protein NYF23_05775 [SAR92 clade bacterium H455]